MDLVIFSELIANLGFPVAVCGALFWSNRETVKHYETLLLEFRNSLDSNTSEIRRLFERINKG